MHQVAAHHPICVHHQVVEGLLVSWRAGDGGNAIGFIANGNQSGIALNLPLEAGLCLVAIEIEADARAPRVIERWRAEHSKLSSRAIVALEVGFVDAHHRDRPFQGLVVSIIAAISKVKRQVVDEQVGCLHYWRMLQYHQQPEAIA